MSESAMVTELKILTWDEKEKGRIEKEEIVQLIKK